MKGFMCPFGDCGCYIFGNRSRFSHSLQNRRKSTNHICLQMARHDHKNGSSGEVSACKRTIVVIMISVYFFFQKKIVQYTQDQQARLVKL